MIPGCEDNWDTPYLANATFPFCPRGERQWRSGESRGLDFPKAADDLILPQPGANVPDPIFELEQFL